MEVGETDTAQQPLVQLPQHPANQQARSGGHNSIDGSNGLLRRHVSIRSSNENLQGHTSNANEATLSMFQQNGGQAAEDGGQQPILMAQEQQVQLQQISAAGLAQQHMLIPAYSLGFHQLYQQLQAQPSCVSEQAPQPRVPGRLEDQEHPPEVPMHWISNSSHNGWNNSSNRTSRGWAIPPTGTISAGCISDMNDDQREQQLSGQLQLQQLHQHEHQQHQQGGHAAGGSDHRLGLGLTIFQSQLHSLYQRSMLQAGYAFEDVNDTSSPAYRSFLFLAWKTECERLSRFLGGNIVGEEDNISPL
jgi:hypothetical protein